MKARRLRRRDFLKGAAAAAAATLALPTVAPASALGGAGRLPPSERIGIAFIGPGHRGSTLVSEFSERPEVEPLAVCDVRKSQRDLIQNEIAGMAGPPRGLTRYEGCKTYIDFRDVLARRDIDAVVVSTPEHWRPIQCILAAEAGKDIYTEKPFALTIREGVAMVEAIRRYGRIFQHGTQRRSNNEAKLRDACEMVRSGRIGKVTHAVVSVGPAPRPDFPDHAARTEPPPAEVFDWDLWLGPAPWRPYPGSHGVHGWQEREDFGLGSIGNWGSHVLDMAQWALGKDVEGPVEILPPTTDAPHVTLRYADGVEIRCPRTPDDSANVAVFGTEGAKTIFGGPEIQEKYDPTPIGTGDTILCRPEGNDHNRNWLECIRSRKKTICDEEVGYRSGSLCMLIHISDRLRRALRYDPVRAEFPGDSEANRLLDRPRRAPWRIF